MDAVADNKFQPRCMEHLRKLGDTNEGEYTIVRIQDREQLAMSEGTRMTRQDTNSGTRFDFPRTERSDMIDAFLYSTVKIVPSKLHPKHTTRKYKAIFKAHPLVTRLCWMLRRWIWVRPWIEAWYPDDADAIYIRATNTMVVGERHYRLMKGAALWVR